ncbi:MAG: DUF4136 domain-containing protein, partial [bacterium]
MKGLKKFLFVFFLFSFISCSSISVRHDYDPDVDFAQFKTFSFMQKAKRAPESLLDKRVKAAVRSELQAKGLRESTNAQLLIAYHSNVKNKVDVTAWGYRYRPRWGGYGARGVTVDRYKQGTLILDFVERRAQEVVWRAAASGVLDDNPTPEEMQKQ